MECIIANSVRRIPTANVRNLAKLAAHRLNDGLNR
jgi:hypothetical protein